MDKNESNQEKEVNVTMSSYKLNKSPVKIWVRMDKNESNQEKEVNVTMSS